MPKPLCEAIIPKSQLDLVATARGLGDELVRNVKTIIREDFEPTTETWEHKVRFTWSTHAEHAAAGWGAFTGAYVVNIYTNDRVWNMLDQGTRPHTIRPKRAKILAFPSGHTAKTQPRRLRSYRGGSSGPTVFAPEVHHPGTEPREWTKVIARKRGPWLSRQLQLYLDKWAREHPHSLR